MEDTNLLDVKADASLSQVLKHSRDFAKQAVKQDPLATVDLIPAKQTKKGLNSTVDNHTLNNTEQLQTQQQFTT